MARNTPAARPSHSDSKLPAYRLSIEIQNSSQNADAKPELHRCGALWAHENGGGFGGYFVNTGTGRRVRVVLFEPKDGEYDSQRNPDFKVFVEVPRVSDPSETDLIWVGLAWRGKNDSLSGHMNSDPMSGRTLRFAAFPPKDKDEA